MNNNFQEYDKVLKKRITKVNNSKNRPNSSFVFSSTNYTIHSLYNKGERNINLRKSNNLTKYTKLNNSCLYKNRKILKYNSMKSNKGNKNILYEDSLKLKTKINKLKKELVLIKRDNLKKEEEIKKRKRDIYIAKNQERSFDNLKEENIISKLKDNYDLLKNKLKTMKENNNNLFNELKNINIFLQERQNSNNLLLLKNKIEEYNINLKQNYEFNNKLSHTNFNREEYFNNHNYIQTIHKQLSEKNKKIFLLKETLTQLKSRYDKIEQERKKLLSYNSSLEKRNEKLLIDKKTREDFILQKPVLISKINEYEKKIKGIEDENRKNESEIEKLSNASKTILKQIKNNQCSKPMNYDKLKIIENDPFENMNQKIILLESLIKESQDRQNEFIEIFEYYDDYVQQKEKYDLINNEAKLIEEKNLLNINNINNINNLNENNNESNEEKKMIEKDVSKDISKDLSKNEEINNEKNEENIEENKNEINAENILNNSLSSHNSKNKEKIILNKDNNENQEENIEKNNNKNDNTKKEKKYKNFQFLLSIIIMNQRLQKENIQKILSEKNSDMTEDEYLFNISKSILNLIDDKNEKDIKTLTDIFKYQLREKYSNDVNTFIEKIIPDFLEKNKFTLVQSEDDENLYLSKIIQLYGPVCNNIIEKITNFSKEGKNKIVISYKNLKKIMQEENLYSPEDKEKKNILKFFIYVLKKNASYIDESYSINDFLIEDILNFLKGMSDIISGKKLESDELNEDDDGLTITDEDFKKIMNAFIRDLNKKLEEKKETLEEFLGEENIKEIEKDKKSIKVINIYNFVEKLRDNDINLNDNLIISCIFNRYQIRDSSEDISINALKSDLEKKQVILE